MALQEGLSALEEAVGVPEPLEQGVAVAVAELSCGAVEEVPLPVEVPLSDAAAVPAGVGVPEVEPVAAWLPEGDRGPLGVPVPVPVPVGLPVGGGLALPDWEAVPLTLAPTVAAGVVEAVPDNVGVGVGVGEGEGEGEGRGLALTVVEGVLLLLGGSWLVLGVGEGVPVPVPVPVLLLLLLPVPELLGVGVALAVGAGGEGEGLGVRVGDRGAQA